MPSFGQLHDFDGDAFVAIAELRDAGEEDFRVDVPTESSPRSASSRNQ